MATKAGAPRVDHAWLSCSFFPFIVLVVYTSLARWDPAEGGIVGEGFCYYHFCVCSV